MTGTIIVTGELFFPFLLKKNELKDKYSVDIGKLNKADLKKLKDFGVDNDIKSKKDDWGRGNYITVASSLPITNLKFNSNQFLSEGELSKLGNGTKVKVLLGKYATASYGTFLSFIGAKVLEAVWYEVSGDDSELYADEDDTTAAEAFDNAAPVGNLGDEDDDEIPF